MAGRGPAPKEPEERRRRNAEKGGLETLPAEGHTGAFPPLPAGYQRTLEDGDAEDSEPLTMTVPYSAETTAWYADWARSPMATKFTPVEWNRLRYVIAPLFDSFLREPSTKLASELRLQETLLGATHADRLRSNLRVADTTSAAPAPKAKSKRRTNLRAVS